MAGLSTAILKIAPNAYIRAPIGDGCLMVEDTYNTYGFFVGREWNPDINHQDDDDAGSGSDRSLTS